MTANGAKWNGPKFWSHFVWRLLLKVINSNSDMGRILPCFSPFPSLDICVSISISLYLHLHLYLCLSIYLYLHLYLSYALPINISPLLPSLSLFHCLPMLCYIIAMAIFRKTYLVTNYISNWSLNKTNKYMNALSILFYWCWYHVMKYTNEWMNVKSEIIIFGSFKKVLNFLYEISKSISTST